MNRSRSRSRSAVKKTEPELLLREERKPWHNPFTGIEYDKWSKGDAALETLDNRVQREWVHEAIKNGRELKTRFPNAVGMAVKIPHAPLYVYWKHGELYHKGVAPFATFAEVPEP